MDDRIQTDAMTEWIRSRLDHDEGYLLEMALQARAKHIPICLPETAALLKVLVRMAAPMRILEAGTAIGYSAAIMSMCQPLGGILDTMEIDEDMAEQADNHLTALGLSKRVRVLRGDAADTMQCLQTPYDLIFLDAAKGQYMNYLTEALRLLTPNGLLICDNVLYKGLVAASEVKHKHRTIQTRLVHFLDELLHHPSFETSLLQIGDGITLSVRKNGGNA
jgi:predicted O-methyltransferase YrrM